MKILIAGGTGFIGKELISFFSKKNHEILVLSRSTPKQTANETYIKWDSKTLGDWKYILKDVDVLINFVGKSVDCRYNEKNKREILDSRVRSVKLLEQGFKDINHQPKVWINSSTATIYRHETFKPNDEYSTRIGEGFSVNVAKAWEKAVDEITLNCRKVKLRIAIVLGNSGGAFVPYKKMAQFGFGGKHGNGEQYFSWIHIADLVSIIDFSIHNENVEGIINCAAPKPIKNKAFMNILRKKMSVSIGVSSPKWILKVGAFLLGTETELLLKSRWVISERLPKLGYSFIYPTLKEALNNLINNESE